MGNIPPCCANYNQMHTTSYGIGGYDYALCSILNSDWPTQAEEAEAYAWANKGNSDGDVLLATFKTQQDVCDVSKMVHSVTPTKAWIGARRSTGDKWTRPGWNTHSPTELCHLGHNEQGEYWILDIAQGDYMYQRSIEDGVDDKVAIFERPVSNIDVSASDDGTVLEDVEWEMKPVRTEYSGIPDLCNSAAARDYPLGTTGWKMFGTQELILQFTSNDNLPSSGTGKVGMVFSFKYLYPAGTAPPSGTQACFWGVCKSTAPGSTTGTLTFDTTNKSPGVLKLKDLSDATTNPVEILELLVKYKCLAGTDLVFEGGNPKCKCHQGLKSPSGNLYARADETCTANNYFSFTAKHDEIEVSPVAEHGNFPSSWKEWKFEVAIKAEGVGSLPVDLGGADKVTVGSSTTFRGLLSGRRYLFRAVPLDDNGAVIGPEADNEIRGTAVTHCSCDPRAIDLVEETGSPLGLELEQDGGFISFSFQPYSRCADAYALTRQEGRMNSVEASVNIKEGFCPNFYFKESQVCSTQNHISTGRQAADDLSRSRLNVGSVHTYCARALSSGIYMHHPSDDTQPTITSSIEICAEWKVRFEASVRGKVTLEPQQGALAVEEVRINWKLLDVSDRTRVLDSGSTTTRESGTFEIVIKKELDGLSNSLAYPIEIAVAKQSLASDVALHQVNSGGGLSGGYVADAATSASRRRLGQSHHWWSDGWDGSDDIISSGSHFAIRGDSGGSYNTGRRLSSSTPAVELPFRLNCGDSVTDSDTGVTFESDDGTFVTGGSISSPQTNVNVKGADPFPAEIYHRLRHSSGSFKYQIPVPLSYRHVLTRLHFAEDHHDAVGERIFSVKIQGEVAMARVDLCKEAGPSKFLAYRRAFVVSPDSTTGIVEIEIIGHTTHGIISALEILPLQQGMPGEHAYNLMAKYSMGSSTIAGWSDAESLDEIGRGHYPRTRSWSIANAAPYSSALYQTYTYGGNLKYVIPGFKAGKYAVRLHFVEPTNSGWIRRFNVFVNGIEILHDFNIYSKTNNNNQQALSVDHEVDIPEDGLDQIVLTTTSISNKGCISALEIWKLVKLPIQGVSEDQSPALFSTLVECSRCGYSFPVPWVGLYLARLYLVEYDVNNVGERLMDIQIEDHVETDLDVFRLAGKFKVFTFEKLINVTDWSLDVELSQNNSTDMPAVLSAIEVVPAKWITHTFSCHDGMQNCTSNPTTVHVRHLDFAVPVHVYDTTSVMFGGRVVIDGTHGVHSGIGCPVEGAEVCLVDFQLSKDDASGTCVKTDYNGYYELPATVGKRISVKVSYYDHEFVPVDPRRAQAYEDGILISGSRQYLNNDFKDVTKAEVFVQVAGGPCDFFLGNSEIELEVQGVCEWSTTLTQGSVEHRHVLPAAAVTLTLADVRDAETGVQHAHILDVMEGSGRNKLSMDFRELDEEEDDTNSTATSIGPPSGGTNTSTGEDALQDMLVARFQFDGDFAVELQVSPDRVSSGNDTCEVEDYKDLDNTYAGCSSLHVVERAAATTFTLTMGYTILGETCTVVDEDTVIRVVNKMGPSEEDMDGKWVEYDGIRGTPNDALLKACSEDSGGCLKRAQHDESGENAKVDVALLSGPPNIADPFLKNVEFTVGPDSNPLVFHRACVLITGKYAISASNSVSLPTHKPLLVIRDPPGGNSYASYNNVVSTIVATHNEYEKFTTINDEVNVGVGAAVFAETCTWAVAAGVCLESATGAEIKGNYHYEDADATLKDSWSRDMGATFTTSWSYSTGSTAGKVGRAADTFVVPNLNVKFYESAVISWDPQTCSAATDTVVEFDLQSPNNEPALSFLTMYHIESYLLPNLNMLINETAEEFSSAYHMSIEEADSLSEAERTGNMTHDMTAYHAVARALDDWETAIAAYEQVNSDARGGKLEKGINSSNIGDWFQKRHPMPSVSVEHKAQSSAAARQHFSSLVPFERYGLAEKLDHAPSVPGDEDGTFDLADTHVFEFSGGGSGMEITLSDEGTRSHLSRVGGRRENFDEHHVEGGSFERSASIFGFSIFLDYSGSRDVDESKRFDKTKEQANETSIVFGLSDPDWDDKFVVAVFVDPVYGTFVFHTEGGVSTCPHEANTDKGLDPHLEVQVLNQKAVLPDEPIIFTVKITNMGTQSGYFEVFSDHSYNEGMLTWLMDGDTLIAPINYEPISPGETIFSTLEVYIGPGAYSYKNLRLGMRNSYCEDGVIAPEYSWADVYNHQFDHEDGTFTRAIVFAQPCPEVYWAADFKKSGGFTINKEAWDAQNGIMLLTLFNKEYLTSSFEELRSDQRRADKSITPPGRLEGVHVLYRRLGETDRDWRRITEADGARSIDFSNSSMAPEDDYGYARADWHYTGDGLSHGHWEIAVETVCEPIDGAPNEFNRFRDSVLLGIIDLQEPKLHGSIKPQAPNLVWPGDDILVVFTEDIECELINVAITIEGVIDGVTNEPVVYSRDNVASLNLLCEGNVLKVAFTDATLDELLGNRVDMTVYNIFDAAGNRGDDFSYSVVHADVNLHDADTSFEFSVSNATCSDPPTEAEKGVLKTEIETQLGFEEDSLGLQITAVSCHRISKVMTATVLLTAEATGEGTRRRRLGNSDSSDEEEANDDHSLGLVKRLAELSSSIEGDEESSLFLVGDIRVHLGAIDQTNHTLHAGAKELLLNQTVLEQLHSSQQAQVEQLHQSMEEKLDVQGDQLKRRNARMEKIMEEEMTSLMSLLQSKLESDEGVNAANSNMNDAMMVLGAAILVCSLVNAVALATLLLKRAGALEQDKRRADAPLLLPP